MLCLLIILQVALFYKYRKSNTNILEILIYFNLVGILIFKNISIQMIYTELIIINIVVYNTCPNIITYILILISMVMSCFNQSVGIVILVSGIMQNIYSCIKKNIHNIYHQRAIELLFYTIFGSLYIFTLLLLSSSKFHLFFLNLTIIHIMRLILVFEEKLQIYKTNNIFMNILFPSIDKITY